MCVASPQVQVMARVIFITGQRSEVANKQIFARRKYFPAFCISLIFYIANYTFE